MPYQEYQIIGRHAPTTQTPNPKIYRMRIFAKDVSRAKSKFWYFMRTICPEKIKKATSEILACNQIHERKPLKVKNFGIVLRYNYAGPAETSNMYKEVRALSRSEAVHKVYQEMAGNYKAPPERIQIISVVEVAAKDARRATTKQFHTQSIKFPLPHRLWRPSSKQFRSTFKARRPKTHFF